MVLVIVTTIYVYVTKRILDETRKQSTLSYNPVLGVKLESVHVGQVFGPQRRQMGAEFTLLNIGNAPAVNILCDAEVVLKYSNIDKETEIPSRHEPTVIPFIQPGEAVKDFNYPNFGNTCVTHVLDDFRECSRLNKLRLEKDPTQEAYHATKLRIYAYYRNTLNQYFESIYEVQMGCDEIPQHDEIKELHLYPDPHFHSGPTTKKEMDERISLRNSKRNLCGW